MCDETGKKRVGFEAFLKVHISQYALSSLMVMQLIIAQEACFATCKVLGFAPEFLYQNL